MHDDIVATVVRFRRRLAARHVAPSPAQSTVAVRALEALDERSREQMYWALRAAMVSRAEDIPVFDAEFALFWQDAEALVPGDAPIEHSPAGPRDELPPSQLDDEAGAAERPGADPAAADDGPDEGEAQTGVIASRDERLALLDFSAYSVDDLAEARRLMWQLVRELPRRRTRRLESSGSVGRRLDMRGTVRSAMRTDTELMRRTWLVPKTVERRLVLLVDVSGSMERYAMPLLVFCQAAIRHGRSTEAFSFGTRLTRLTPHLRRGPAQAALERATRVVPDWAGGTRIGDSLHTFDERWGRRGMAHGALVVIVSDGWERGDLSLLERELVKLHRASHALLWINPVAGDPGYRPLVGGMATALRHVDGFAPAHNLRSLQDLVVRLQEAG